MGGQRKIRQFERDLRSKITIEHPLLSHLGAPAAPAAQARRRGQKLLRPRAYQQIISGKISFRPYAVFKINELTFKQLEKAKTTTTKNYYLGDQLSDFHAVCQYQCLF